MENQVLVLLRTTGHGASGLGEQQQSRAGLGGHAKHRRGGAEVT